MAVLVIAPNYDQYREFVQSEALRRFPHTVLFSRCREAKQLQGRRGILFIVNEEQCDLTPFAGYLDEERFTINRVELR